MPRIYIDTIGDEAGGRATVAGSGVEVDAEITALGNLEVGGTAEIGGNTSVAGTITATGNITTPGTGTFTTQVISNLGTFQSVSAPFKLFDIIHPSKEDMRLRHGCLEGPELAVYFRGKSKSNTINLPEYWKDLVDESTITVHLTATTLNQQLLCLGVVNNQVLVNNTHNELYHFIVYGERKDVEKLDVEINA